MGSVSAWPSAQPQLTAQNQQFKPQNRQLACEGGSPPGLPGRPSNPADPLLPVVATRIMPVPSLPARRARSHHLALAGRLQDLLVDVLPEAEPLGAQGVQHWAHQGNQSLPLRKKGKSRGADDLQPQRLREPTRRQVVEDQTTGTDLEGETDRLALARM